jgi:2-methylcitrate dehydratase PrpD
MGKKDAAFILASHIAATDYTTIPKEVIESTKRSILDTLGVMVGGSGMVQECRKIAEFVKKTGGREESSILVFGGKVPAIMAALANGAMGHVLNYDDIVTPASVHPTSPTLPAALAIAERMGKVSGKDFITAVALGIDLIIRMGLAVRQSTVGGGYKYDWQMTPLLGTFSSAAVAAKLLEMNEDKIADALGIAFLQAAGSFQMDFSPGASIAYHRDAFPAKAGVLSALMAQQGITGIKDCLQSKAGLYNLYFRGNYDPSYLTDNLGKRFEGTQVGYKAFPVCGCIPTYLTAALDIVHEQDLRPEDIVEIMVPTYNDFTRDLCEPLEERRKPLNLLDASMSLPFCIATAIAKRKVNIGSFSSESLQDPITLEVAQKVITEFKPELNTPSSDSKLGDVRPGVVEIKTKSGRLYSKRIDYAYGHPQNPMTMDDLVEKFRDCVSYAAEPIPKRNIERVIDLVLTLEKVDDIAKVVKLFT